MKLKSTHFLNSGQTLVEVVLAIAVAVLVIAGLARIATISIRNAVFARTQAQATHYTSQAGEWLRAERDSDWTTFAARATSDGSTYCLTNLTWDSGNCTSADGTIDNRFVREATLTLISASQIQIAVSTTWTDSIGAHAATVQTVLTSWRDQ